MPVFTLYVTIFVLKSFSFQLLLSLVRCHFRLYFVSVLLIISVSVFVSVNEYITDANISIQQREIGCVCTIDLYVGYYVRTQDLSLTLICLLLTFVVSISTSDFLERLVFKMSYNSLSHSNFLYTKQCSVLVAASVFCLT